MLDVGVAKLLRLVVFFQVVFALRQSEAALERGANHLRTVLSVLRRIETKERSDPSALKVFGYRLEVCDVLDCSDARQLGSDGFCSRRIDGGREQNPSDRKSTRLNSSHDQISYAVFC